MRDAYDKLFSKYNKDDFFREGVEEIIFVPVEKLALSWEKQKEKLLTNKELFIRGYGRNGVGTNAFIVLYKYLLLNENIKKDATNNAKPTQILTDLTGLCKVVKSDTNNKERIQNYQVSHLFGRTKNPLLFTAPWNIAYIPKYLDPFTGHETQGDYRIEFQKLFLDKINYMFRKYVEDYNHFVFEKILSNLEDALALTKEELEMSDIQFEDFRVNAIVELSEIKTTANICLLP